MNTIQPLVCRGTQDGGLDAQKLSRRAFLRSSALATLGLVLMSCAKTAVSNRVSDPVELVYQDWRTEWFPPMVQQMLSEFHDTHPGIRVYYTPDPEQLGKSMLADMQAGTAADVFSGCCTHFPVWAQQGYTLDLAPYVDASLDQQTIDDWDKAQYGWFSTEDGMRFGLPKYHGALALYYNKDLFDARGIPAPSKEWNHDAYARAMRALATDRDGDGDIDQWGSMLDVSWDRVQVHVNGWGGHLVDPEDRRRCLMDAPEALDAMEWIRTRMWQEHSMATFRDVQNASTRQAFALGLVAMVEDGSWALKDILEQADFQVGVAPFPAGPVRRVTLASTDGFGIYSGTRHADAAWELIEFLTGSSYGRAMAKASLLQPARISLLNEWASYVHAEFPQQKDLDVTAFADGQINGYSVTAEVHADMALAESLSSTAWERIFTLGQASVDEMHAVCQELERAQEKSN